MHLAFIDLSYNIFSLMQKNSQSIQSLSRYTYRYKTITFLPSPLDNLQSTFGREQKYVFHIQILAFFFSYCLVYNPWVDKTLGYLQMANISSFALWDSRLP